MVALMDRQECALPALYNHRAQFARSALRAPDRHTACRRRVGRWREALYALATARVFFRAAKYGGMNDVDSERGVEGLARGAA